MEFKIVYIISEKTYNKNGKEYHYKNFYIQCNDKLIAIKCTFSEQWSLLDALAVKYEK